MTRTRWPFRSSSRGSTVTSGRSSARRRQSDASLASESNCTFIRVGKMTVRSPLPARRKTSLGAIHSARSEEHTSELQSLMRISYAVFCLKKKKNTQLQHTAEDTKTKQQL